ncbi:type III-B CRISPR module RAMP protein Cmr4 [Sphingobacteriales bacterium UPWRP_1]|nr:type III-B CRISPR module RAMP protein Cmr4 [Sphingobacteriales bacterium UPWRP_1]
MYKKQSTLFMLCETPLHAGSGDDLGIVDLPIQRERHTHFPKIEASSLKGALREAFETANGKEEDEKHQVMIHRTFGYDEKAKFAGEAKTLVGNDYTQYSGCLAFTDARLLLFPVKSMKGVFVWLTCKQVLNKFASDMGIDGTPIDGLDAIKALAVTEGNALVSSTSPLIDKAVVLEEYAFEAAQNDVVTTFATALSEIVFANTDLAYWKSLLQNNLVILSDNDFRDFTLMSTEVITRTKIDNETGTVEDGALFTEEYLPTDSVLYSLVLASDEFGKKEVKEIEGMEEKKRKRELKKAEHVIDFFNTTITDLKLFQLGGNATLGKGILRAQLKKGGNNG